MSNFLEIIGGFFGNIFGNSPDALRKKDLRKIEEFLLIQHPPIYQRNNKKVLPPLPLTVVQFQKILAPLQDLFQRTVNHPDPKISEIYREYLLENLLEGDVSARRAKLSYESLKPQFLASASLTEEIAQVNREFTSLVTTIKKLANPTLFAPLERVYSLGEWFKHPTSDFFQVFHLSPDGSGTPIPAEGDKVLMSLLDLYFVFKPLNFDEPLETALAILFERLSPQKATENMNAAKRILQKVKIISQGIIRPQILEALIKILQDDPYFDPPYARDEKDYLDTYIASITEKFERDRDRAAAEVTESGLEEEVVALFQDRPLLEWTNFNPAKNQILLEKGLNQFSMVKPASLFRSFLTYHLNSYLLNAVEKIITEGAFLDKAWASQLSNTYSLIKAIDQRLLDVDLELIGEGRATLTQLEKLIGRSNTPNFEAPANRLIDMINKKVESFLVEQCKYLFQLADYIRTILEDFKRPTPDFVSNIRIFGEKRNRAVLQDLLNGYKAIIKLLGILKNFLVMPFLKFNNKEPT